MATKEARKSLTGYQVVTGYQVGEKICEILGIEAKSYLHITIDIPANGAVTVNLKRYISEEELTKACHVIRGHELVQTFDVKPDTVVGEHRG